MRSIPRVGACALVLRALIAAMPQRARCVARQQAARDRRHPRRRPPRRRPPARPRPHRPPARRPPATTAQRTAALPRPSAHCSGRWPPASRRPVASAARSWSTRPPGRRCISASPTPCRLPASVEKLYTTTTAAIAGVRTHRHADERACSASARSAPSGVGTGTLYLRGGGDPTFGSEAFDSRQLRPRHGHDRAAARAESPQPPGSRAFDGMIVGDESLFDALRGTPATGYQPRIWVEGELSGAVLRRRLPEPGRGFATAEAGALRRPAVRRGSARRRHQGCRATTPVITGATPPPARSC